MAKIRGIDGMSREAIASELQRGGRFVQFQYCVSALIITFKRGTDVYLVRAGESPAIKGLGWTLLTFVAGWWGIPWGPIYTVQSLWVNLRGGHDLTAQVANTMQLSVDYNALGAAQGR